MRVLVWYALLTLITSLSTSAQPDTSAEPAWIVDYKDSVEVKRENREDWLVVRNPGFGLHIGDVVRSDRKGRFAIHFLDGSSPVVREGKNRFAVPAHSSPRSWTWWDVIGPLLEWRKEQPLPGMAAIAPELNPYHPYHQDWSDWIASLDASLEELGFGRVAATARVASLVPIPLFPDTTFSVEAPGQELFSSGFYLYPLSPSRGLILSVRPSFAWIPFVKDGGSYNIEIRSCGAQLLCRIKGKTVWRRSGIVDTTIAYPNGEPALTRGHTYHVEVRQDFDGEGTKITSDFTVAPEEVRASIKEARREIEAIFTEEDSLSITAEIAYASVLIRGGFFTEAMQIIHKANAKQPGHRTVLRLWSRAFREALMWPMHSEGFDNRKKR